MASADERLRTLLDDAAVEPSTVGVVDAVHAKRRRRATRRRAAVTGAVAFVVAVLVVGTVLVRSGDEPDAPPVAVPHRPAQTGFGARVHDPVPLVLDGSGGRLVAASPIAVDASSGYLRGPVRPSGEFVAVAAYERDGDTFRWPPSRVLRIAADGSVVDEVRLLGEVLSLSDGEGARWILTRDAIVIGPEDPEYRVKRIGLDGGLTSAAVPPGDVPVGDLVAGGGGVWVPVRDGVLRFDPATGEYAGRVPLEPVDRRAVASFGKGVSATTTTGLVLLDPASMQAVPGAPRPAERVVDVGVSSRGTWALVDRADADALVAVSFTGRQPPATPLPGGFVGDDLVAIANRIFVTGSVGARRVVLEVHIAESGRATVERAIVLGPADEVATTVVDANTIVVAADGRLWRLDLS